MITRSKFKIYKYNKFKQYLLFRIERCRFAALSGLFTFLVSDFEPIHLARAVCGVCLLLLVRTLTVGAIEGTGRLNTAQARRRLAQRVEDISGETKAAQTPSETQQDKFKMKNVHIINARVLRNRNAKHSIRQ